MKHIAFSAVLAALVALVALSAPLSAQSAEQGAGDGAMDSASRQELKKPATAVKHRARQASADARTCLRFNTNVEITRCAEKYR